MPCLLRAMVEVLDSIYIYIHVCMYYIFVYVMVASSINHSPHSGCGRNFQPQGTEPLTPWSLLCS